MPTSSRARRRTWSKASARSARKPRRVASRSTKRSRASKARRKPNTVIAGHSALKSRVNALKTRQSIHFRKDVFAKEMDARVNGVPADVVGGAPVPRMTRWTNESKKRRSRECHAGILGCHRPALARRGGSAVEHPRGAAGDFANPGGSAPVRHGSRRPLRAADGPVRARGAAWFALHRAPGRYADAGHRLPHRG